MNVFGVINSKEKKAFFFFGSLCVSCSWLREGVKVE